MGRSFCAFCAAPLPEEGAPCCEEYEAGWEQAALEGGVFDEGEELWDDEPEPAPARDETRRAPFVLGSQFLVGLLVSCVTMLALVLVHQARIAEDRARELEATRRLSEEMIAVMKESRRDAPLPAIAPQEPASGVEAVANVVGHEPALEGTAVGDAATVVAEATEPGGDAAAATTVEAGVVGLRASTVDSSPTGVPAPPSSEAHADAAGISPLPVPDAGAIAEAALEAGERSSNATRATRRDVEPERAPAAAPPVLAVAVASAKEPPAAEPHPGKRNAPAVDRIEAEKREEVVDPVLLEATKSSRKPSLTVRPRAEAEPSTRPEAREKSAAASERESGGATIAKAANPPSLPEPSGFETEAAIRALASRAFPPSDSTAPPRPRAPTVWSKLERGMTRREVEALLGEPRWVDRVLSGEFWLYSERSILGRGWVAFSERGVVMEWLEP